MDAALRRGARPLSPSRGTDSATPSGGANVSFTVRGETQRIRFQSEPALSFVPEARAPPNGC